MRESRTANGSSARFSNRHYCAPIGLYYFLLSAQYCSKMHERAPSITVSSIMFPNERVLRILAASRHVLGKVFLCSCNMPGPHYRSKIEKRKCKNFLNLWRRSDWNRSRSCAARIVREKGESVKQPLYLCTTRSVTILCR